MQTSEDIRAAVKDALGETVRKEVDQALKALRSEVEPPAPVEVREVADDDLRGGFKSLAHFARDVARASLPGPNVSKELSAWANG